MNYEEMVESLNKDYLMVRKGRWLFFLGGAAAFVIAAGFVSYQAALAAVGSSAATQAVTAIETLLVGAQEDRDKIGTLLAETSALRREAEYLVGMLEKDDYIMRMKNQSARIMSQEQTIEKLVKFSKRFDAIKFGQLNWPGPDEFGTRLIPTQEGICFLTRVAGGFSGNEDEVEIHQREENGVNYWYLTGNPSQGSVGATAGCLSWPRRVDFKVPPG